MSSTTRIQTQGIWPRIQTFIYDTPLPPVIPKTLSSILFSIFVQTILARIELY